MAKELSSPAVQKEQTVKDDRISTYTKQEDVKEVIQKQHEYPFILAPSALITKHTVGTNPSVLFGKGVAKTVIEGTYEIPTDLKDATKLISKEIRKLVMKMRNKEGQKVVIIP
jgi:hypothetical protein